MAEFLPINSVQVRKRLRETDTAIVGQLRDSIRTKGILHPPVRATDKEGDFLVAGLHRLTAMLQLHEEKIEFRYSGQVVPLGMAPFSSVWELSEADLLEAELEENIIHAEVPWQDRARALAAIHELRQKENPKQSFTDTAKELAAKAGKDPSKDTRLRHDIRNATLLSANLHRPSVAKARNATEALGILLKEEHAKIEAELINRKAQKASSAPPDIQVVHGDLTKVMPTLQAGMVDLIIADLPYGIGADTGGFRSRTVEHHNYEDTSEVAQTLMQAVITEGFRVAKPRANLFIFGDIDLFPFFKRAAAGMGWKPFRTPVVWRKSDSEGLAPWGREGFRRTYELIFFATKGQRGLIQSPVDILDEKRVGRSVRRYGPEKPVPLLELLLTCATMPGDFILDPCCGAGSTLAACRHLKRKALGIELDLAAYNMAVVAANHDEPTSADPSGLA